MSISVDGVKFIHKSKKGIAVLIFLTILEFLFTILLFISLSANIWMPERSEAATAVSKILSYQGRLTDTSGNPLGGSGTTYCFRFSIYDASTSGNKLWPTGTPSNMTTTVTNGVFNLGVGDTGAGGDDLGSFNFYSNDTIYLNVAVATYSGTCGTFEDLSPRQRIDAVGYSRVSRDVYGDLLRTLNATSLVQIGTGAGSASPILFALDVKNTSDTVGGTCSTSGTIWYNSTNTKALICDAGIIQEISNAATIVGIKESGAGSTINAGTVVFSNDGGISISQSTATLATNQNTLTVGTLKFSNLNAFGVSNIGNTSGNTGSVTGTVVLAGGNNITLSQNGSTITISAANAGGGGNTYYSTILGKKMNWQSTVTSLGHRTVYFFPEIVQDYIAASAIKMPVSISAGTTGSSSGQVGYTFNFGVYTRHATNSTVLTQHYSTSYTLAKSNSSNVSMALSAITAIGNSTSYNSMTSSSAGINLSSIIHSNREFILPWNTTLTPGEYWFAFWNSTSLGGTSNGILNVSFVGASSLTNAAIGVATSVISGNNVMRNIGLGYYSATSAALPAGVSLTQIARIPTNATPVVYMLYNITQ